MEISFLFPIFALDSVALSTRHAVTLAKARRVSGSILLVKDVYERYLLCVNLANSKVQEDTQLERPHWMYCTLAIVYLCEKFSKFLFKERCWKRTGKLKHNTAVAYLNAFLSVVALAYKDGILQNDNSAEVQRIHWNHDTKKEYLEESEIQQLEKVDYSENPMVKQAALLSVYTGLRRADIINLEWKDINLRYKNKSSVCLTVHKTRKVFNLPLSTSATRLLRTISRDSPRVFPGLTEFMLNKEVPLLMEKANIDKHITFHTARHSFAMALLNKGTDIYTIAKLMGHKSVTSTQVYAKLSDEQLRKAILKL